MKNTFARLISGGYGSVGLFGLGKSNSAILELIPRSTLVTLRSHCDPHLTNEQRERFARVLVGADATTDISEELLILSPSVRRDKLGEAIADAVCTSDAEMFLGAVNAPVFAVSGSDGKSTTATLTAELLRERYPDLSLCGNIGKCMCAELIPKRSAYVIELSSFQLSYLRPRVLRAALTNITPNHLDWHDSFQDYRSTKLSLLDGCREAVVAVDSTEGMKAAMSRRLFGVASAEHDFSELSARLSFQVCYTTESGNICRNGSPLFPVSELKRQREHDLKNLLTSLALTDGYTNTARALQVAREFDGLPHRCRTVAIIDGVEFIDSSIDTSPARTESTLRSLGKRVTVLLGGKSKGVDFRALREPLKRYCDRAILFGACRHELEAALTGSVPTASYPTLGEAINFACQSARSGVVLLSPAATSYDEFTSFEERGAFYKNKVLSIKSK